MANVSETNGFSYDCMAADRLMTENELRLWY